MDNFEDFCVEVADLAARVNDMCIAYAKLNDHKPQLILSMVIRCMNLSVATGNFDEYTPNISGVIRSLTDEELAEYIADIITENRTNKEIHLPSPLGGYAAMNINDVKDIKKALNECVHIGGSDNG